MLKVSFALLATLALTNAAPHYGLDGRFRSSYEPYSMDKYFQDDIFDTNKFWRETWGETFDILGEFQKRFKVKSPSEGFVGDKYVVTIPLHNYDEKDIVVKANKGSLLIQAVHNMEDGSIQNYLHYVTLPDTIGDDGTWTYENNVLKMEFPVNKIVVSTEAAVSEENAEPVTEAAVEKSREEMEESKENEQVGDADVGLQRGDNESDNEILTNEIPKNRVEATTYAVGLRDEVEFVPMKYK